VEKYQWGDRGGGVGQLLHAKFHSIGYRIVSRVPPKKLNIYEISEYKRVFSASRVQQVSDLHLKFALRPHHVWKEVWQTSNLRRLRLGEEKKERKKKEQTTA